jgi:hypothetical protein
LKLAPRAVLAFLLAFGGSATAKADWQNTNWCMTQGEVTAAAPQSVAPIDSAQEKGIEAELAYLKGRWSSGSFNFEATYFFDAKGGLERIRLRPSDCGLNGFVTLRSQLRRKYGKAESESKRAPSSFSWRTQGELVALSESFGSLPCEVNYMALRTRNNEGL